MANPESISISPGLSTEFSVEVETMAVVTYRLWIRRAGETWVALDWRQVEAKALDHWVFVPPLGVGSEFAYSISAWGRPYDCWQVRFTVSQKSFGSRMGEWTVCDSWTEGGVLDASAYLCGEWPLSLAPHVMLTAAGRASNTITGGDEREVASCASAQPVLCPSEWIDERTGARDAAYRGERMRERNLSMVLRRFG